MLKVDLVSQPRDFWIDESYQYLMSEKPVSFIIDSPDVHPPLFNLFTKGLFTLGFHNPIQLRVIMIILSILFIVAFYTTVKEIFNFQTAVISTFLISISPTFIYYSTEFRSYIFVSLFTILQIKYFFRLINKKQEYAWIYYTSLSLLMVYSHYMASLVLVAQFMIILVKWKFLSKDSKKDYILFLFNFFCFSVALIIYTLNVYPKIQSFWFKNIDFHSLVSTFSYIISPPTDYSFYILLIYVFVAVCYLKFKLFKDKRIDVFLYILIVPVFSMWIISQIFPFYHHRYFLFGGLSIFIILGYILNKLWEEKENLTNLFIIMIIFILLLSYGQVKENLNTEIYDSVKFLKNYTNDESFITIHTSPFSALPYMVYFPNHKHYLLTNLTRQNLFTAGGEAYNFNYLKSDINQIINDNHTYIAISEKKVFNNLIYELGGLYVTKK